MKIALHFLSLLFLVVLSIIFPLNSASAQKWDTLASVPTAMTFPVVAVLDKQIHIMGGGANGGATKLHYAYDPLSNTWSGRAPVPYFAQQPAGAANEGKIHYFGGGFPNSGTPLKDHWAYSPDIDSWAKAADLTAPRAIHSSVSLDGVLYTLGGQGVANLMQSYNAASDNWETKASLPDNSFWYGAHVAAEGHIYRFGGGSYTAPTNKANVYDPTLDMWTSIPSLPNGNHSIKGAAIGDKIYLAGGYHDFLDRDEVWIYDTKAQTYTAGLKLPIGRKYHNMATIDSCIYVIGGDNAIDPSVSTQLIRYCPYGKTSNTRDVFTSNLLSVNYSNGKLSIWLPGEVSAAAQVIISDALGRQISEDIISDYQNSKLEIYYINLNGGIYFIRVAIQNRIYAGKVVVNQ